MKRLGQSKAGQEDSTRILRLCIPLLSLGSGELAPTPVARVAGGGIGGGGDTAASW